MKKILLTSMIILFASVSGFSQGIGMRIEDSGTVRIYGRHDVNPAPVTEQFRFDKFGSFFAKGNLGIGIIPVEGPGYRTMWHSYKASFRSGYANREWDDSLNGFYSWAGGYETVASGIYSLAFGSNNFATGTASIALGHQTKVFASAGFAAGSYTQVYGTFGAALGNASYSKNIASMAFGYNLVSKGFASTVIGMYNDSLLTTEDGQTSTSTPLFIVGNGSSSQRSNAMVVRKTGEVEVKKIKVGAQGTSISQQVAGTFAAGSGTEFTKIMTFNFPATFPSASIPRIVITPRNEPNTNYPDEFIVTVRSITNTQVTINIRRLDASVGWSQNLQLDWIAWL